MPRWSFARADELIARVLAELLSPPPPVDLPRWTEESIRFGPDDPFPGPYSFRLFPFFRRIAEVLGPEDPARVVTLKKSAQIGGTILGDAFLLGWLDRAPARLLCVHPTLNQARAWVNNKIKPKVRASPALQAMLSFDAPEQGKATELLFERLDARGGVIVTGANSAAGLSQHSVKAQLQDDLSKWEMNEAGDPEAQADSRSQAYEDAKIFKVSTPMVEGECRIDRAYQAGSRERYHIPCPQCRTLQPLEWEAMKTNIEAALARGADPAEGAFFACQACGFPIEERHRAWMVDPENGARWVAENPKALPARPSFYLWSAYAPLMSWRRIAEAWATARGDPHKEQTFLNDVAGLTYRRAGEAPKWETLKARADAGPFRRGRIAPGYYFLFAGADVQENRIEVGVWAFGPELRRQAVDHIVIEGRIAEEATRRRLDEVMERRTWPDAYGNARTIRALAIDCGFEREHVLDWAARYSEARVIAVVGSLADQAPIEGMVQGRASTVRGRRIRALRPVFVAGVSTIKSHLYGDLPKEDPLERGFVALPAGFDEEWFAQLTAEVRRLVKNRRGFSVPQWVKTRQRNEALDCAVYAHFAAHKMGWRRLTPEQWATIAADMDRPPARPDLFSADLAETTRPAAPRPAAEGARPAPRASFAWLPDARDYWKD